MQIFDNMTMNYNLIVDMSTWMGKLSGKMSKSMAKLDKIKHVNKDGAAVSCSNGAREFLAKRGDAGSGDSGSAPSVPSTPTSPAPAPAPKTDSAPPAGGSGLEGL